jgi:Tfp pilus assembly protein PilF
VAEKDDDPLDVERVFAAFQRGVRQNVRDDDVETHFDLGLAYFEMGLLRDAESELTLALKYDPNHAAARAALELVERRMGADDGDKGPIGRA